MTKHMKTIGLLGGTDWSSTIGYYKILNELVGDRLGGYHSAKIILKSIDYHDIMSSYGQEDHKKIAQILKKELQGLIELHPDCIIICCNSLHKYYDMIKEELASTIPVMHAVELVAKHLVENNYKHILLLATKFTMEDRFFANILEKNGIKVTIPDQEERDTMKTIHDELMQNIVTAESTEYFASLIRKHQNLDAVVLGCTEYPLVVDKHNSALPIVDPVVLQATYAVDYALGYESHL
jgi:aspartate racemase